MDKQTIATLIDKYYAGETTAEEERQLEAHFAATQHRDPEDATEAIFRHAQNRKAEMPPEAFTKKLNELPLKSSSTKTWWIAAAVLAFMIICSFLSLNVTTTRLTAGSITQTLLPDGTQVWLNKGSVLIYEQGIFGGKRDVTLDGEAYFEVFKDRTLPPFIIHTGNATTTVTGTAFNLRNFAEETFVELSVLSGTVLFGQATPDTIPANTQAVFDKKSGQLQTQPLRTSNAVAWKERKLAFYNTSLASMVKEVERYFEVDIELVNPGSGYCHLTAEFNEPNLEEILVILKDTFNGSYRRENNTYYLAVKPCEL
jgi:transmembrane sensor